MARVNLQEKSSFLNLWFNKGANQDADTLRQLFEMLLSNRPAPTYMNMPPIRESNIMPREAQAAYLGQNRHQMEVARPTTRMAQNTGDGQTPVIIFSSTEMIKKM